MQDILTDFSVEPERIPVEDGDSSWFGHKVNLHGFQYHNLSYNPGQKDVRILRMYYSMRTFIILPLPQPSNVGCHRSEIIHSQTNTLLGEGVVPT